MLSRGLCDVILCSPAKLQQLMRGLIKNLLSHKLFLLASSVQIVDQILIYFFINMVNSDLLSPSESSVARTESELVIEGSIFSV